MNVNALKTQAQEYWQGLSTRQRWQLGIIFISVFTGLILLIIFGSRTRYVPLYTNLADEDSAEVVRKLEEMKVPYKVSKDGSTISVPDERKYQTRWELANAGIPKGGVQGFELFDQTKLGTTEAERRVNFQRALEGELTRTFQQIDGVAGVRVSLTIPQETLFVGDERKDAKAAILVTMKGNRTLSSEQVAGIVNFTAHSVEGLSPENVTVIDNYGRVLSAEAGSAGSVVGQAKSLLDMQFAFQEELQRSVTTLLEQVLGPGNAVVRVNATLNFDQKQVSQVEFNPKNKDDIVRDIQELKERFTGTGGAGGVPGTTSNAPGAGSYTTPNGTGTYDSTRTERTIHHEIDEIRTNIVAAPGTVERLTVTVVVNREALSAEERQSLINIVAAAVGLKPDRGDEINVTGMPFHREEQPVPNAEAAEIAFPWRPVVWGAVALLGVLVAGGVIRKRRMNPREEEVAILPKEPPKVDDLAPPLSPEELEKQQNRKQIEKLVKQKPAEVAALLKTWINEE